MADSFFDGSDNPKDIEKLLLHELQQALSINEHNFRYPTLLTSGIEYPTGRTVVLRQVDGINKKLYFYTDKRSDKVRQIKLNHKGGLHFYHHRKKLQLRLWGELSVIHSGALWEKHFQSIPISRYREYSTISVPGEKIEPPETEYPLEMDRAKKNFALLEFSVEKMEALQLNENHHFRIEFNYRGSAFSSTWLQS